MVNGRESVHIGRPLQNCRIYILDEFQNPLPPGSVGELYIAGDCLARGYHNREELTKERFMNDPFRDGGRMYRTGDFGKWSKDGKIFYLGRRDDQVKLLGHRVELSEIESVLMRHEKVETAAAGIWENRLIAYYTGDALLTESELLTFAANYLPRYLLPAAVARVDAFPLNNNGKIDFTALEKPVLTGGGDSPADEVEEKLLAVWRKVLEREELDVHSDYFMSGGDSLNAVLMLLEVEKTVFPEHYRTGAVRECNTETAGQSHQRQRDPSGSTACGDPESFGEELVSGDTVTGRILRYASTG